VKPPRRRASPRLDIEALMDRARAAGRHSPNRVRQVGAFLVAADGKTTIAACNTFPKGVRDLDERHEGDGRFVWMEHAERNAILEAARRGVATQAALLATTFFPCIDCARAIVQCGIARLVTPSPAYDDPIWGKAFLRSRVILEEGGVGMEFTDNRPARASG
jgi:dCMP deaminase